VTVPWFKVDDRLAMHPKVMQAGNAAMGLWVRAGSWSAQNLTDGHIPVALLASLGGKRAHADALVKAGLWEVEPNGWRFHEWTGYQPSASDVKLHKEAESEGANWGNHKRWHTGRGVRNPDCQHCQRGEK
jgi:hypothetical protein